MTAVAWTGPAAIAAAVLAVAGAAKVVRPHRTAQALGGRFTAPAIRLGAAAEIAVGAWALTAAGSAPRAAVALSYVGFLLFLAVARGRGWALSSCGCFGEPDTPPTWAHGALNAGLAAVSGVAAVTGAPSLAGLVADDPAVGTAVAGGAAVGSVLVVAALTVLPRVQALGRAVRG